MFRGWVYSYYNLHYSIKKIKSKMHTNSIFYPNYFCNLIFEVQHQFWERAITDKSSQKQGAQNYCHSQTSIPSTMIQESNYEIVPEMPPIPQPAQSKISEIWRKFLSLFGLAKPSATTLKYFLSFVLAPLLVFFIWNSGVLIVLAIILGLVIYYLHKNQSMPASQ